MPPPFLTGVGYCSVIDPPNVIVSSCAFAFFPGSGNVQAALQGSLRRRLVVALVVTYLLRFFLGIAPFA